MAWHKTHKENSKDKILTSAAMLFTQGGFEQVSIDDVMKNAQLTRGAFYSHFRSKSDLYAQAIAKAAQNAQQRRPESSKADMALYAQYYLSKQHRDDDLAQGCPLAFLVSDITQQDEQVRQAYTETLQRFIAQAEQSIETREQTLQSVVMMIGGLAISRALNDTNLSNEILAACQQGVFSCSK
ncbi:TetR/AcrR family transcriptional regulator [Colwellia sp. D2M02]|uniref:TetR/AcrR family transcriptional regulator n=1 Tax=Colwellia sp. D2M02 TaxID=2841562 RepID=UPI001C0A3928|nr:TetR/AcrR family transcriptional regulator [Colwellia sp. D2M02]MBU2893485.1 TetR/AcrR family transcriptional regulator [Colwellia sp. D2M02]